jgi:mRNA interferase RelE/StbE
MATPHMPAKYTLLTLPAARRQLRQLQKTHNPEIKNIVDGIMSLAENPRPLGSRKLAGRSELRIRIGNYRVLYSIDDVLRTVTISVIAHRREVYR